MEENENKEQQEKRQKFRDEQHREATVCVAVQKRGFASVHDIIDQIDAWKGRITEIQAIKCAENLRRRDMLSMDIGLRNAQNVAIKRYVMKKLTFAVPEIAQVKDVIDNADLKPLLDELERSKGTHKKGLKTYDYYVVGVKLAPKDNLCQIRGFMPKKMRVGTELKDVNAHYRDSNDQVYFEPKHIRNWFRDNLCLINRGAHCIGQMKFDFARVQMAKETEVRSSFVVNINSQFSSSMGTGGRGEVYHECLPDDAVISTEITVPRDLIPPERFREALNIMCVRGSAFGGSAKISNGKLRLVDVEMKEQCVWEE
jgi:hypothetical protein